MVVVHLLVSEGLQHHQGAVISPAAGVGGWTENLPGLRSQQETVELTDLKLTPEQEAQDNPGPVEGQEEMVHAKQLHESRDDHHVPDVGRIIRQVGAGGSSEKLREQVT